MVRDAERGCIVIGGVGAVGRRRGAGDTGVRRGRAAGVEGGLGGSMGVLRRIAGEARLKVVEVQILSNLLGLMKLTIGVR